MSGRTGVRTSERWGSRGLRAGSGRVLAVLWLAAGLAACGGADEGVPEGELPSVQEQNEGDARAAVNASARVLAAISEGDSALVRAAFVPGALIISKAADGTADTSDVSRMAQVVAEEAGRFAERMWDPAVDLAPESATVTAAYDFYVDGSFSHCGVDVFTVVPHDGELKVSHLEYTVAQPPACEMHPAGPPSGD